MCDKLFELAVIPLLTREGELVDVHLILPTVARALDQSRLYNFHYNDNGDAVENP